MNLQPGSTAVSTSSISALHCRSATIHSLAEIGLCSAYKDGLLGLRISRINPIKGLVEGFLGRLD